MKNYKELTIDDAEEFYGFINQFACYSDLSFVSLICWSEKVLYHLTDTELSVIFEDYESNQQIITGITSSPADSFIRDLIALSKEQPSLVLDALPGSTVEMIEDPELRKQFVKSKDQSDYLYRPASQLNLEGSAYSWYRRKIAIFFRKIGDTPLKVTVDTNTQMLGLPAYDLIWQDWSTSINHKEAAALHRYITYFPKFRNQCVLTVTINHEIKAFAFLEITDNIEKTLLIHFFKSIKEYEGLANYLFQEIAKYASSRDIQWINFEQDVGEEGLRQYKQKLCPDTMLEKFSHVSPNN